MALKECRECNITVSTGALVCPHCGVSDPAPVKSNSSFMKIVLLCAIVWLAIQVIAGNEDSESSKVTKKTDIGDSAKSTKPRIVSEYSLNQISKLIMGKQWYQLSSKVAAVRSNLTKSQRQNIEKDLRPAVKLIPATRLEDNKIGYRVLAMLAPNNAEYKESFEKYSSKIIKAAANRKRKALGRLIRKHDKISKTTFFTHRNKPKYINSRSTAYLYIGSKSGKYYLRMQIQYASTDWLFVNKVIAYFDGIAQTLHVGSFERDNNASIWEWVDVTPNSAQLAILEKLANAEDAILRFEGSQYRKDVRIRQNDKTAILEVLEAYNLAIK
ncbi:MAG: hypothetical protein ABJM29_19805 [Rhizobiaceae bacterium]